MNQFNSYPNGMQGSPFAYFSNLNPLKRVNSILTNFFSDTGYARIIIVSIPSNGSIQFLRWDC